MEYTLFRKLEAKRRGVEVASNTQTETYYTVEEYYGLLKSSDRRFEYWDGEPNDVIEIVSVDVKLTLSEIYRDVELGSEE
jgi:hypothetical protein